MTSLLNKQANIRLFTALISLFLSSIAFYSDDIINRDGILYINMAEAFIQGGFSATAQLYNWPFFSVLIAQIHTITSLPLEITAALINSLLFVVFTDAVLMLSSKILENKQQLIIAAFFILCFQTINEYRDFIVRDIGYWALCSLTLYRFILFLESAKLRNASLWQLVAVIAVLFRIEGIVILLMLPLYLFFHYPFVQAAKKYLQLNYLFIIAFTAIIFTTVGQSGLADSFSKLTTILSYIDSENILTTLHYKSSIIADQVLNQYSAEYSTMILVSGLLFMLLYKLVNGISIAYITIYLASFFQKMPDKTSNYKMLILYFVLLNLLILTAFLFQQYFMSKRYTIIFLTGVLLLLLPRICRYIELAWHNKNKLVLSLVGLVLLIGLIDSMTQSGSKAYIKTTAEWASQNLADNSRILLIDSRANYYFHKYQADANINYQPTANTNFQSIIQAQLADSDYLVVIEKRSNTVQVDSLQNVKLEHIYSEQNKRKDRLSIYRIQLFSNSPPK